MTQFVHVQTHPRSISANRKHKNEEAWTVAEIAAEARRDLENSKHVKNPKVPIMLVGDLTTLESQLDEFLKKDENKNVTASGTKRAARQDAHVMISNVYSWPEHVDYYDEERLNEFISDCLDFHKNEFGRVDAAVLHLDEEFPHIHVYTFDKAAKDLHAGELAKKQAYADGKEKKEANEAYCLAMELFQDKFYNQVGKRNGLDRTGPRRQRFTRREYRQQKEERLARADRIRAVEKEIFQLEAKIGSLVDNLAINEQRLTDVQKNAEKAEKWRLRSIQIVKQSRDEHNVLKNRINRLKQEASQFHELGSIWNKIKTVFGVKSQREKLLEKELISSNKEIRDRNTVLAELNEKKSSIEKELNWVRSDLYKLQDLLNQERKSQQTVIDNLTSAKDELHNKYREVQAELERMQKHSSKHTQKLSL